MHILQKIQKRSGAKVEMIDEDYRDIREVELGNGLKPVVLGKYQPVAEAQQKK